MPYDPQALEVMAVCAAVIAGLACFAVLLLLGRAIVVRFHLPQDLPEGPRYEPPPPVLREHGDRAGACAAAAAQRDLAGLYARGLAIHRGAQECRDLRDGYQSLDPQTHAALIDGLTRCAAMAAAAQECAEQALQALDSELRRWPGPPPSTMHGPRSPEGEIRRLPAASAGLGKLLEQQALAVQGALVEARQLSMSVPVPRRRWIWAMLLALLVLLILWTYAMTQLRPGP